MWAGNACCTCATSSYRCCTLSHAIAVPQCLELPAQEDEGRLSGGLRSGPKSVTTHAHGCSWFQLLGICLKHQIHRCRAAGTPRCVPGADRRRAGHAAHSSGVLQHVRAVQGAAGAQAVQAGADTPAVCLCGRCAVRFHQGADRHSEAPDAGVSHPQLLAGGMQSPPASCECLQHAVLGHAIVSWIRAEQGHAPSLLRGVHGVMLAAVLAAP